MLIPQLSSSSSYIYNQQHHQHHSISNITNTLTNSMQQDLKQMSHNQKIVL